VVDNPYYSNEFHGDYDLVSIGRLDLEEGGSIPDCQLAVTTSGTLNEAKDNAILIVTWFSGTHQIFRDVYVGDGHALDPGRYFVVMVNQIGSGLSTSPHNAAGANAEIAMSKFPKVTIGDDVVAQQRLLHDHFGVETLQLVLGGSMGAQQTYEWAVRFPDRVLRAAPIAGTAQVTPHDVIYTQTLMDAITSDPGWNGGDYGAHTEVTAGLHRHAGLWAAMGLSTEWWKREGWRAPGWRPDKPFTSRDEFVHEFLEASVWGLMDPDDLLCMAWKWQHGDVARHTGGDLAAALGRITARTYVMPISEDMFFPVRDCRAEQELVPGAELRVLDDLAGHLSLFGVDPGFMPQVDRHLRELLDTPA
jgi:homoserine O-acetyltransferase/O-succinyltransferase